MSRENIALFAFDATRRFAEGVATALAVPLSDLEEREFEDGEHKSRPLVNVRNRDTFVIQSLYSDAHQSVNDKLCRLLFFIGCLRDASAASVTAVIPYLAYGRKDRKTQPRDPVTTRYVASLLEAVGTDRIVTLDAHNLAAFQNAFRCRTDHLEANPLFVDYFTPLLQAAPRITVIAPDAGGMKRAEGFRKQLGRALKRDLPIAFMEKSRSEGQLKIGRLAGEVTDSVAIVIDDLISSGGTLLGAAEACRKNGAQKVYAAASHGVFVGAANELLAAEALEQVVVTDTIAPFRLEPDLARKKLVVLSATGLFGTGIRRIVEGGSLTALTSVQDAG